MVRVFENCSVIQLPFVSRPSAEDTLDVLLRHEINAACILFTCLRSEIYVVGSTPEETLAALLPLLPETTEPPAVIIGFDAVSHIFEVACGLQSNVLGESEILGQLRAAHAAALTNGMCHGKLDRIIQGAVAAGKRVRAETILGHGSMSVSSAIHAIASSHGKRGMNVVVVGAGFVGRAYARLLCSDPGSYNVCILNRTVQTARELAEEIGAVADQLCALPHWVTSADVVLFAVDGTTFRADDTLMFKRGAVVVDVCSPSVIDPSVRSCGVLLYTLGDIENRMGRASHGRRSAIPEAKSIVAQEIEAVETWCLSQRIHPLLRHVEETMRAEGQHDEATIGSLVKVFRRSIFSSIRYRDRLPTDIVDGLFVLDGRETAST
ncbi:MAG TPA: NAD(P)-binding domain-containing protein [Candidatus Didemnitutus sp.]|nr:NAD(P)-binding domain-containing protein [Candidatus Didemnitutus sp.]